MPNSYAIGSVVIDGLPGGDAADGSIDVTSYDIAGTLPVTATGGGGGVGKVSLSDFHFVKKLDKASPSLMVANASGKRFKTVTVSIYRPGTTTVEETIELDDAVVSSVKQHADGSTRDSLLEDVGLSFTKISEVFTSASGAVVKGDWDVVANKS